MPIINNESQTEEQINAGNQTGESKRQSLAEKIKAGDVFKGLDIPTGEPQEVPNEPEQQPEEGAEESEEDVSQAVQEEENEDAQADDPLEDMVPKSKIQPRIDKLKSENLALKARLEEERVNRQTQREESVDETTAKLQKMTPEELKTLRREVRVAQLDSKDDKGKLKELLDLEDKIDDTVRSAPQRFASAQLKAYNNMADKVASGYTAEQIEKAAPRIREMAQEIYARYPRLQNDIEGQAIALEIAADKYKELSKFSLQKGSVKNLKSQVNTLKRKTSLDNGSSKPGQDTNMVDQLRKNASSGNRRDKEALIKNDPRFNVDAMIPSEYK